MVSPAAALLTRRARAGGSSAIRDLLDHARRPGMISLAGGVPDPALFPVTELAQLAAGRLTHDAAATLQYGTTRGEPDTRAAFAARLGASADPDQIVITTGSQQALDLMARVLIEPGDEVFVADPDYLGMLQVLGQYGARLTALPTDADGIDTEAMEALLRAGHAPKACYVVPHFHNPTGATMSLVRRRHLHDLASRYGFLVIEDDPYRDLAYDAATAIDVPGDPEWSVRLRSTSKTLAPGLRVGALAGPGWLTDAVVIAKQAADLHTSTLSQAIVADALRSSWFDEHVAGICASYCRKRNVLVSALRGGFGETLTFDVPGGGMFVWARFAGDLDTHALLKTALDHDVCFVPGAAFSASPPAAASLRLSFATATPEDLVAGVERLAAAVGAMHRR